MALAVDRMMRDMTKNNIFFGNWYCFCENQAAISLLEKNTDKINWMNLSFNINAISLLEKNRDKGADDFL